MRIRGYFLVHKVHKVHKVRKVCKVASVFDGLYQQLCC